MRIIETRNARFIENVDISGSVDPRKVEIKAVRVHVSLPITSSQVVPIVVEQFDNLQE